MTDTPSNNDYSIAVVVRTLDLLEALAEAGQPLGPTELARRVGTTKSAAHRILATLGQRDYVVKDKTTPHYRLGMRLAYLGQRSLETFDLRETARPTLEDLHQRFRETVNLGVLEDREIVYIDMIESDQGLRMSASIGARDHIHSTSIGKSILAFLPESRREQILQQPLAPRTAKTITDPATLRAELKRVREAGYAEDRGENEAGAHCFGAPIIDHTGAVVAAISVSAPASRLDERMAAEIPEAVKAAAQQLSRQLGGYEAAALAAAAPRKG